MRTRNEQGEDFKISPICPYNLAEAMGFNVRFLELPSFEGMYIADKGVIYISAERPEGRKRFSCAHEIGHHVLGHGTAIDEIIEHGSDITEEMEADYFASMLLMPQRVVRKALNDRDLNLENISDVNAYKISSYLGVSYTSFLTHCTFNLKLMSRELREQLIRSSVASIKERILGYRTKSDVFCLDRNWVGRSLDINVGDYVLLPTSFQYDSDRFEEIEFNSGLRIIRALSSGVSKMEDELSDWSVFSRISKKHFAGICQYRHLEDED